MAQAKIKINGAVGSNDNLPIGVVVNLNNQNTGGETTFLWSILDQPEGTADALSANNIQNPTFTPKKEGTYLLQLVVNGNVALTDTAIVGIRYVKTRDRAPAAGETVEDSATTGWELAQNRLNSRVVNLAGDPGIVIGTAAQAGLTRGDVLTAQYAVTIKSGLPGQEVVPGFTKVTADINSPLEVINNTLYILEGGVDGSTTPANGALIRVRVSGRFAGNSGAAIQNEIMYVSNTGTAVSTFVNSGDVPRIIGKAISTGNPHDFMVNGEGGALKNDTLFWGVGTLSDSAADHFLTPGYDPGTESATEDAVIIAPANGTFGFARVHAVTPPGDDIHFFIVVNGTPTEFVVLPGGSNDSDSTGLGVVKVVAGDFVSIKTVADPGGSGSALNVSFTALFWPADVDFL